MRYQDILNETAFYHGTDAVFDGPARPSSTGVFGRGIYLAREPRYAKAFGENVQTYHIRDGKLASVKEYVAKQKEVKASGLTGYDGVNAITDMLKRDGFIGVDEGTVVVIFDTDDLIRLT